MIINSPVAGLYGIVIPSLGVLFAGLVMLEGVFNKATAYVALAIGLTGVVYMGSLFIDSLDVFRYINALLAAVFYLLAGYRLYKLGKQ